MNYQQQNWEGLLPVLSFLKDVIGEDGEKLPSSVIIDMGIINPLMSLLGEDYSMYTELQAEVSWLFANISAGTTDDTVCLIREGMINTGKNCLHNISNDEVHENVNIMF